MRSAHRKVISRRVHLLYWVSRQQEQPCSPSVFSSLSYAQQTLPPSSPNPRRVAGRKRALLARFAARASSATKIQAAWRGKMARDSYLRTRCSWLASREIQRMYRGHLGRRTTKRRREWQSAGPGPERLKLGLRMIEDTKVRGKERTNRTPMQQEGGMIFCRCACWDFVEEFLFLTVGTLLRVEEFLFLAALTTRAGEICEVEQVRGMVKKHSARVRVD